MFPRSPLERKTAMSSIGRVLKITGIVAIGAVVASCASPGMPDAPGVEAAPEVTPELIAQGQALYAGAGNCRTCHGASGQGTNFGPSLADGEWLWFDADSPTLVTEIAEIIRTGIPEPRAGGVPMPAMGGGNLNDDQLLALGAYVASLSQ